MFQIDLKMRKEDMVDHKFGEFAPTRQFFGHTPADKKAKVEGGEKGDNKK